MAKNQKYALCPGIHLDFIVVNEQRKAFLESNKMLRHGCNVSLAQEQTMMFLFESMHRYGYKASPAQRRTLSYLLHGGNVILHPKPNFVLGKSVIGGVLLDSSPGDPVTLQTLVEPKVMPGGGCISVNVEGTYVLGRRATCSLGVLCQLDLDDPVIKCQCLILRVNSDTPYELAGKYLELTEDMRALAFPRAVQVEESLLSGKLRDSAHVTILALEHLYNILEWGNEFDFGDIKMVVFDWACEASTHYCAGKVKMIKWICDHLNKLQKKFQVAIFSENIIPEPACGELLNLLDANSKLNNVDFEAPLKCTFLECEKLYGRYTLKGIEKHLFVELKLGKLWEKNSLKLKKIMEIVKDTRLCEENRIIIFINRAVELSVMIKKLEGAGIDYVVGRDGMTQRDREELVEHFLSVNLMVTNDRWHRDMPICYFDAHVHSIIHYKCIEDVDMDYYVKRVRWFRKVDNVITLVSKMDCTKLLELQESLGIVFERKGLGKIGGKEFVEQKHYLLEADLESYTLTDELSCYFMEVVKLTAFKRAHIVFFVSDNSVDEVVSALEEAFGYIPEVVITSSISKLEIDKPCLLVTTDGAMNEESDATLLNGFKKNVHVVISVDKPMKVEDYRRRCGWSKSNGVVVHFGAHEDFFELCDDVQVVLGVRLEVYWPAWVCDHLTRHLLHC